MHAFKEIFLGLLSTVNLLISFSFAKDLWSWECNEGLCTRLFNSPRQDVYPSIGVCRLVCGDYGPLWPRPTKANFTQGLFEFKPEMVRIYFDMADTKSPIYKFLEYNVGIFHDNLESVNNCPSNNEVKVYIKIKSNIATLNWDTDESYTLRITTNGKLATINIVAQTIFGARHGLETLSQLISIYMKEPTSCLVLVEGASIVDKPVYSHRGLLLDTARNFLSVPVIKNNIKAMGASKMNVLHWHISDSQSFPLDVPNVPFMSQFGAYAKEKIYRAEDVKDVIVFARLYGVRVIIEIDAPSHAGNGWQWGPEKGYGNLTVCYQAQPWRSFCIQPPCGQLNPANGKVYQVLGDLYADIMSWLPKHESLHMGGDEVFFPCWNASKEILDYIKPKPRTIDTFLGLWAEFQRNALAAFDNVTKNTDIPVILWSSHLTEPSIIETHLNPKRYIIQTWVPMSDDLPVQLIHRGYQVIISTKDAWYLDHGFWGSTTYHTWRLVYDNKIPETGALGGEVCMWGEYVDDAVVISRTWPRAAAAAERLWTNPTTSSSAAEGRFYLHRARLVQRGIKAEAIGPKWCEQNEGQCK